MVWATVEEHRAKLGASGELEACRRQQARSWMWNLIEEELSHSFRSNPQVVAALPQLEKDVEALETTPAAAARRVLGLFAGGRSGDGA